MKDLSIIIVNYNAKNFLRECLQSLTQNVSKEISYEVFVVDNNSPDDSSEMVKTEFPHVHLIANKDNKGFSAANNQGVERSTGRYILFLNPDTVVYKDSMEKMVRFMDEYKDAGAATCFLELNDGTLDDAAHRGFPTPWNAIAHFSGLSKLAPHSLLFNGYHLAWRELDKIHEIDALAGAFMIVRRQAGEDVGWWDEDYFFYGEDLDFCYKLKKKGWKIYFVPSVKIRHFKGVTGGIKKHSQHISTANRETRLRATNARFDAMKIFYGKHYTTKYPKWLTNLVLQGVELKRQWTLRMI